MQPGLGTAGGRGGCTTWSTPFRRTVRSILFDRLERLPEWVVVVPSRHLVPVAAAISASEGLNLLAAEAVATAIQTGAPIRVSTMGDRAPLRRAARRLRVGYDIEPI